MDKLTLSMDGAVVATAKRYAVSRRTSVSQLVQRLLTLVASPDKTDRTVAPVLARLRGSLAKGSVEDYRRHLERKYR